MKGEDRRGGEGSVGRNEEEVGIRLYYVFVCCLF